METEDEWKYEVNLIKAEADGVGPSLLVSASGKRKGPQYLFNVPEGFSRLVLEHKLRPSARLAAVFLTSLRPHCAGGFGGLLLRLADDGHGQLQVIGPDCSSMFLHSLRHILYWRHPKVHLIYRRLGYPLPPFTFVHCKEFMGHRNGSSWHKKLSYDDPVSRMLESLQLHSIQCVWVDHCFQACGLVLSSMSSWSIVYSGDTRPCGRLIQAGIGCTLLIHEATFEDKFEGHARAKQHSTISEALEVGQQMGAQHVILTHFSQRSPQVMAIDISKHQSASLAFDGMVVCSTHLFALPRLMQCLVSLFAEYGSNVQDQGSDAGDPVNQAKQFLGASSKGPSSLPKALCVTKSIDKGDDMGYFANIETRGGNTKAIPTEQYCLPKHIRWEDSESEDD